MKKAIVNSGIGSKVICVVTDDITLEASPIKGTDNGDGTASLIVTSSMATLPDTVSGDLAAQTATLEDILAKIISAPSTEAKQDAIITALGLIASEATTGDIKTAVEALAALISAGALSVSLGELPDTVSGDLADINTASASIDGKLPVSLGKKTAGGSFSVVQADVPCTVSEAEYEMTASAIPLSATEAIYKYLFLMPDAGNSGTIYLGGSAVQVGHSIPIPVTGLTLSFPVQADDIYVIGTALDVLYAISFEEA